VFVEGFTSFTPVEWRLVEALALRANLWVALPPGGSDRPDAFAAVEETRRCLRSLGDAGFDPSPDQRAHSTPAEARPAALAHLDRHLFGPPVPPVADGTGLHLIEAPGPLGEARLVARRIRTVLAAGTPPEAIVVTARDLTYSFDLLGEVFAEYGLPVELDGDEPVSRNPAVGTLLRALRLPDDGWPFAGVTALLRSTYFGPAWPEATGHAARRAEGLLRLLGEPRGREAYLRAIGIWAETPPDGLEDEQAEESRRLRKARLAAECRPFLDRFFRAWDDLPADADPPAFAAAVRRFALDIGVESAADQDPADGAALRALWSALDAWDGPPLARGAFLRRVATLAASVKRPRSRGSAGCVRVVPAEDVRHLDCDYLFVTGLGERSFPRLAPPRSLLDDADRQILRAGGLPFPDPAARLGAEQLLFLQLVGRPRRELILCYAAVDERGQPLLPGGFLRAVRECLADGAVPVERQRMPIEGYLTREPLSPSEARSQFAAGLSGSDTVTAHPDLTVELCEHLGWARQVATARFRSNDFNRYDGWVDAPAALSAVRDRFGPEKVFSPTALEAYVFCPFRFLAEHVLRLEELNEPGEEVEHTRRGAAYHRALARLHRKLAEPGADVTRAKLPETVGPELLIEIDRAVEEYAARAPSPASRKLWQLEGKRLHRSAEKYRGHWEDFLGPWRKAGAPLDPRLLEADFGLTGPAPQVQTAAESEGVAPLVISVGGVEVRIGGRIDRVDVAELDGGLGFWVIDYKTGRSANYSAGDLAKFVKLQLPLYALAVERVFFPGRQARPLGLAYWLVTDDGPKPVLPGKRQALAWLSDPKKWATFRGQLEEWVAKVVGRIRDGHFPLAPRSDTCTDTCAFGQVCRISQSRNVGKVWDLAPPGADAPADGE
jgi:RecB family exonuclease